jgi:hypothetical protein
MVVPQLTRTALPEQSANAAPVAAPAGKTPSAPPPPESGGPRAATVVDGPRAADDLLGRIATGSGRDPAAQQVSVGPAGVAAVNSRNVAARLALTASDSVTRLCARGRLRCCNCGLLVDDSMKLPLRDPREVADLRGAGTGGVVADYVRVPLEWDDELQRGVYSDFVACTPPCALRFMYDSPNFTTSRVPHTFHLMMWNRHRQDEPVNAAPPAEGLSYLHETRRLDGEAAALREPQRPRVGLSAGSFYWLLSRLGLIGYKQTAPMYIPPLAEEGFALQNRDTRFTKYYYQEATAGPGAPPQVGAKLPPDIPSVGVRMDAHPDADGEFDLATDSLHADRRAPPPTPSPQPPQPSAPRQPAG